MQPVPPWLEPLHTRPGWVHTRQSKRFMAHQVPQHEDFDDAFLSQVTETEVAEVLAVGFRGTVPAGCTQSTKLLGKGFFETTTMPRELMVPPD